MPHNIGQDEKNQTEVFGCIFIPFAGHYCLPSYASDESFQRWKIRPEHITKDTTEVFLVVVSVYAHVVHAYMYVCVCVYMVIWLKGNQIN